MKRVIMFFLDAAVHGAQSAGVVMQTAPIVKVYNSEKLTQLRADKKAAWEALNNQNPEAGTVYEFDSPEWLKQSMEVFRIGKLIDGEIAALKQAEVDAELSVKRSERVALNTAQLAAYDAMLAVNADKKATQEAKYAAAETFRIAKEVVDNELLAKYASAKSVTTTATSTGGGERGATGAKILERLRAHIAEGKTSTDAVKSVIAEGFSRGTVGSVRTQMVKDGEIAE